MKMITKLFGSIYVIKFLKFLKVHHFLVFLYCIGNMCPFVEKKERSVVFSLTYKYQETAYPVQPPAIIPTPLLLIINTMSNPPIIPTPPIIRDSRVPSQSSPT